MCQIDRGKTLRLHEEPSRPTQNDFTVASWYEARNMVVDHAYMKMPWRTINNVMALRKIMSPRNREIKQCKYYNGNDYNLCTCSKSWRFSNSTMQL